MNEIIMDTSSQSSFFQRRQIAVTFFVDNPDGTQDVIKIHDKFAINATIEILGNNNGNTLSLIIYGLPQDIINRLSFISEFTTDNHTQTIQPSKSSILVEAGNYKETLTPIFSGKLGRASIDYSNLPDILFSVHANSLDKADSLSTSSRSYKGTWSISDILKNICDNNQIKLIDHGGWNGQTLTNQYLHGSFLEQIKKITRNTRAIYHYIPAMPQENDQKNTSSPDILEIWGPQITLNENNNDTTNSTLIISPKNGMINYPTYTASDCHFTSIFNPNITFFAPIKLDSPSLHQTAQFSQTGNLAPWQGIWRSTSIIHKISSEISNGDWLTEVKCNRSLIGNQYVK